jgi:hypothetical protein
MMTRTLIISYRINGPSIRSFGHRIWSDGQTEGYQTVRHRRQADGHIIRENVMPEWVSLVHITPRQVEVFRQQVIQTGLYTMPATVTTQMDVTDGGSADWQFTDGNGELKTITITPWPPDDSLAPLMQLVDEIGTTILETQNAK